MIMGLVARSDVKGAVELALKIADFLTEKKVDILLDMPLAMELEKYQDQRCELEDMDVDMVVAIGGDGTILRTQSFISHKKIPLIGINMGTVGFLTEIDPENAFTAVWHNHELPPALNEVVLMTRKPAKMLHIQISVDDEIMEELRADGLIIATPSGSTAYSMSAGGPIIDPKVKAFIIVPICPFKLGARPTVVSDESIIKVKLLREGKKAIAVIDGQFEEEINYMDEIIFRKSDNCAYFVRLTKDFYRKVREKLTQGGIS